MKLSTIQKREKLNIVVPVDEIGPGGAYHHYVISDADMGTAFTQHIQFQNGPRNKVGSVNGVIDSDLLEIVRHRLQCFLSEPYPSKETAMALKYVEKALKQLNKRVEDRIERNVLGKNEK